MTYRGNSLVTSFVKAKDLSSRTIYLKNHFSSITVKFVYAIGGERGGREEGLRKKWEIHYAKYTPCDESLRKLFLATNYHRVLSDLRILFLLKNGEEIEEEPHEKMVNRKLKQVRFSCGAELCVPKPNVPNATCQTGGSNKL